MSDFICKKCGSKNYKVFEKSNGTGIATGLYCADCGAWQKWLNKQEKAIYTATLTEKWCALLEAQAKKTEEAEHRAEVAERALCNALNDDSCYFCNKKSPCECEHRDWGSKECITVLLRQAEKELQEEKRK